MKIDHQFVATIPDKLRQGVIYISLEYNTAAHLCSCGCGVEVITPISPKQWQMSYNGEGVSLFPSIGNWSFECRSHYWIKNGQIKWASAWSHEKVSKMRGIEIKDLHPANIEKPVLAKTSEKSKRSVWSKIKRLFS